MKNLTFKTVFLLTLGSGKRRSEIHAWFIKEHQTPDSLVQGVSLPLTQLSFENQLAKVVPWPQLWSLKADRSLKNPVLLSGQDLRQNKELVFVSFKKGFDKDLSPATISSWINQTVILCYELFDLEALTLHQVKAHDGMAFVASKVFKSGVSLEDVLSACHWKSHNTFTQFHLKGVAWDDSELFHLGLVVAAQQIHHLPILKQVACHLCSAGSSR